MPRRGATAPLVDAHCHFRGTDELDARRDIFTVYCGTDPDTARQALALAGPNALASCGLHPWQCQAHTVAEMRPFIDRCPILGEIGLDSVWTEVDMDAQRAAFTAQLHLARALERPIVLHTKGMEREIAETIAPYGVRKLVHWYSCMEHLDRYIDQGCWFSVGPDWQTNPAVEQVIARAPLSRLVTETDGLDAVAWALGRPVEPEEIPGVILGELRAIARAKGVSEAEARVRVWENMMAFIHGA